MARSDFKVLDLKNIDVNFINLERFYGALSSTQKTSIETLKQLCSSEDDNIRLSAAKTLLRLNIDLADRINQQNLNVLVNSKKGNFGQLSDDGEERNNTDTPLVDFVTIRN